MYPQENKKEKKNPSHKRAKSGVAQAVRTPA
jgi:hypothetical protein